MLSIGEVAKEINVPVHRLKHALVTGAVKEPKRLNGRRCFTLAEVERVRRHFRPEKPQ